MNRYSLGVFQVPMTPRQRRIKMDIQELEALKKESSILEYEVSGAGRVPDFVKATFHGKSLVLNENNKVSIASHQSVSIALGMEYPRVMPLVQWLTPILHPNIFSHGVCYGNFQNNWTPHFHLTDLLEILWDYSRLRIFNAHSAYPTGMNDQKTCLDLDAKYNFPVDRRPLRDKLIKDGAGSSAAAPVNPPDDIVILEDGTCQA